MLLLSSPTFDEHCVLQGSANRTYGLQGSLPHLACQLKLDLGQFFDALVDLRGGQAEVLFQSV